MAGALPDVADGPSEERADRPPDGEGCDDRGELHGSEASRVRARTDQAARPPTTVNTGDQSTKGVEMRRLVIVVCMLAITGCQAHSDSEGLTSAAPTQTTKPSSEPKSWVMSADSFGPITVRTTKSEALATGRFRVPPGPSQTSRQRLDWHTQTYSQESDGAVDSSDIDRDGVPDPWPTEDLPSLALACHGSGLESITPGPATVTDQGIKRGSSLTELKQAYGDRLIHGETFDARYAVNGKQSHLMFVLQSDGTVGSFFINRGIVEGPSDDRLGRAPGEC